MAAARDQAPQEAARGARCPVCGRPVEAAARPFCCRRCAEIDLGRWLTGQYVLPGHPAEEDGEAAISPDHPLDRGPGLG
ncbi:MAG: DNA gyrase inhibitor YacG [Rhodospirillales bacterium]|jgi:endogenous inhibitor of DNA gyrase (YacG/DUF329 family)|nr:DNA gyrase inhibitor YacG [Rhodospirillales bacterium]